MDRRGGKKGSKVKIARKKPKKSKAKVTKTDPSSILTLLEQSTMSLKSHAPSTITTFSEYETEEEEEEEGDEDEDEEEGEGDIDKGSGDTLHSTRKRDESDAVTPGKHVTKLLLKFQNSKFKITRDKWIYNS